MSPPNKPVKKAKVEEAAPAPVKNAEVKPASDPKPKEASTTGKIVPKTKPMSWSELGSQLYDSKIKPFTSWENYKADRARQLAKPASERMEELVDLLGYMRGGGAKGLPASKVNATAPAKAPTKAVEKPVPKETSKTPAKTEAPKSAEPPKPPKGGFSTSTKRKPKRCELMAYKDMECDGEKHHVVPDYLSRTGSAKNKRVPSTRIPGTPDYDDAPVICLSTKDHQGLHKTVDAKIQAAGTGGVIPMGKAKEISASEAAKKSGCPKSKLLKQLNEQMPGPDNKAMRAFKDARKVSDGIKNVLNGGKD